MKRIGCFFLILSTSVCCFSQQKGITLNEKNKPLSAILSAIQAQSTLSFTYSSDIIDLTRLVSINVTNAGIEEVLKKLFNNTPITFSLSGDKVLLFKNSQYKVTISGYLREKGTGELLIGATVSTLPPYSGCITNAYGFYSITLPMDTFVLQYNYIGYQRVEKKLVVSESKQINVQLEPNTSLDEAQVKAKQQQNELTPNKVSVPIQEINNIPMILGEKDVVKFIMLSSGVQKGNEGNGYIYVRGGGPDQNLILIDDAVIYNAYHFLGLSSLFSGNELRKAELYKGGFSAKYGGRLSSVLDMSMKDGNRERYGFDAMAGVISSRIMVEGPIQKNKSSFLFSLRKSYISELADLVADDGSTVLDYNYYDMHAKLSTNMGNHDRLMLSAYLGKDGLINNPGSGLSIDEDGISWGNRALSLRWNHQFNGKLFANTSLVSSFYQTGLAFGDIDYNSGYKSFSSVRSSIQDYTLKTDFDYLKSKKHQFKFGAGSTLHYFTSTTRLAAYKDLAFFDEDKYMAKEAFGYGEWQWNLTNRWLINTGLRYSYFKRTKAYNRLEPRLNIQYSTKTNWQFNASYALMNQYLHLVSAFNGLGFPNDVWVSSNNNLAPQRSNQVTLGVVKNNLFNNKLSAIVEVYGKQITNTTSLKEGAFFYQVLPLPNLTTPVDMWEDLATQGDATSYGIEFMVKKSGKRFQGHISYTLSKTTMRFSELNNGNAFNANFDRTHDIGIHLSYKAGKHFMVSSNWVYGTGNPISLPSGEYFVPDPVNKDQLRKEYYYEEKNNFRMQDYHRLDLSVQYISRLAKKMESTIEFSIFNMYNRANPFYYDVTTKYSSQGEAVGRKLQKVSLFPIMPSLSWGVKF
ncbi:MAG: TonB-dependent receptor [Bacteroidetes bacterium]|nr:MAG: TonB-dependent receptor [Bacteroidota bacterium]